MSDPKKPKLRQTKPNQNRPSSDPFANQAGPLDLTGIFGSAPSTPKAVVPDQIPNQNQPPRESEDIIRRLPDIITATTNLKTQLADSLAKLRDLQTKVDKNDVDINDKTNKINDLQNQLNELHTQTTNSTSVNEQLQTKMNDEMANIHKILGLVIDLEKAIGMHTTQAGGRSLARQSSKYYSRY